MCVLIFCLFFALSSKAVLAEGADEENLLWERFGLKLGGFVTTLNSDARIGSATLGAGVSIDVEEALGLKSSLTVFRADGLYRFGQSRKHRLDVTYYSMRRSATKTLEREFEFEDITFEIGDVVDSFLNLEIFKGAYSYSFFQDDRFDIALSAGLYVMPIEIGIHSALKGEGEESITAPLPVIGIRGAFAVTPKIFLVQSMEFFWLQIDKYRGLIIDTTLAVEYNAWKHVGFGAGIDAFLLSIEANGKDVPGVDFIGSFEFNYTGLMLYAKFYY